MSKTEIPSIRFRGFDDAWEQRKFGEIASKYEDPVPTPHDGYYRLGIRSHAKGTFHSYVAKGQELETAQMHRVAAGTFIVNITFGWEHAVAITDENDAGKLVSHRFPQFSFAEGMVPEFFRYVIVDEKFRHHLWLASPGGAGRNRVLKLDDMLNYLMRFPSRDEQIKIAEFFRQLDNLITLHQSKYEKLQAIKASMRGKMFPKDGAVVPEVRFKGFTGAWKRKRFSELYESVIQKNDLTYGVDKNITVASMQYRPDIKVTDIEYLRTYNVLKLGDIAFEGHQSKEFRYGRFVENDIGDGIVSHIFAVFRPKTDYDLMFWKYAINNERIMRPVLVRCTKASTMMNDLVSKDFLEESILVPDIEEQKKIGTVLSEIDRLISLQQEGLKKLQSFKKALLEKMFV